MSTEMKPCPPYSPGSKEYMVGPQQPPPSYGYSPAPPVLSQQSCSRSNAVMINQPSALQTKVHTDHTRAKEYLILTVVMMTLCFLHGNLLAFTCLIPAFCFSRIASSRNDSGDYESARKFGNAALCCNCSVFIYYILLILAGVVLVAVYFTVGFSAVVGPADTAEGIVLPITAFPSIPGPTFPPISFPVPNTKCYTDVWGNQQCTEIIG